MAFICISSALRVVSCQASPKKASEKEVDHNRHSANFQPSIWGEYFIRYSNNDNVCIQTQKEIQELKVAVKKTLDAVSDKPTQHLNLIDDVIKLGLGYHFEEEIEEAMVSMFEESSTITGGYDLHHASLHFMLLRKHGYKISSDIFNKFVNANGLIKEEFRGDIRGLLGLYEAAQLRVHDDVILDQALNASTDILKSSPIFNKDMRVQVALKIPFHKTVPRLSVRRYIEYYGDQSMSSHDAHLLKMAKLDFNLLQQRYQYELSQLTIWWKELGLASKCPFARDRVVELYLWSLAVLFEPQHEVARILYSKLMTIFTIVDDTYDAYGKADELELLTKAITRWDRSLIEQMPEFMKATFEAILDFFDEIEGYMAPQGKSYRTRYLQRAVQMLTKAYYDEYIWLKSRHVPTIEEYMRVAMPSSAVHGLVLGPMVGMGDDDIKEESFEWIFQNPNKMITACSTLGRLKDDMVSHKFEQERGHAPSAVECYMKQFGVSEQDAYKEFNKQVTSAWKDMNECCLKPTQAPKKVLDIILNNARVVEVFYTDGNGLTQAQEVMKNEVMALLVNPIPFDEHCLSPNSV